MVSDVSSWLREHGWNKNPFTLDIAPALLVGHSKEINALENGISEGQKYVLITGPTGIGKTTLLKYLAHKYGGYYMPKPPAEKEDIVRFFRSGILKPSLIEKILKNGDTDIYNLAESVNKKLAGKRALLLIDEAHETDIEMLSWLRSLIEQFEGVTVVIAALPKMKEEHLRKLETLAQRITLDIELDALSKDETHELVKKRISSVGGRNIEPFTLDAINRLYRSTGGFPREVIKLCNSIIHKAIENGSSIIDCEYFGFEAQPISSSGDAETCAGAKKSISANSSAAAASAAKPQQKQQSYNDVISALTDKQLEILNIISKDGYSTPSQAITKINAAEYKSGAHALRAMNNILRRLERDGVIARERKGRTYKYFITPQYKSRFVNT